MGNSFKKDPNLLNFKGIYTDNFSDNIPYLNKLQKDSKILVENLGTTNSTDKINNKKMYNMFNAQESENNFSDTSTLVDSINNTNSATSAANTEINQLLNKIQTGGSTQKKLNNNIEPRLTETSKNQTGENLEQTFINEDMLKELMTETSKNQTGGNLEHTFINEDTLKELMTETSKNQTGGFFWNKKQTPKNETFITKETFKSLMSNNVDSNNTSEVNTEFNNYMNNAITEVTSELEENIQKGGGRNKISSDTFNKNKSLHSESLNSESSSNKKTVTVSEMNKGRYSYESSTAHSNEINSNDSNISSTVSANNDKYLSDSINTSDINMISVE